MDAGQGEELGPMILSTTHGVDCDGQFMLLESCNPHNSPNKMVLHYLYVSESLIQESTASKRPIGIPTQVV